MKYLKTNLENKVKNLPHFRSEALLPVFEAIVNSIQAIEDKGPVKQGKIDVKIMRESQAMLGDIESGKIIGFEITDNGIGFTDENYESFQTSDSNYKEERGGKGVGRFLWLKAFDRAEIESVFEDGNKKRCKHIVFSLKSGIKQISDDSTNEKRKTVVRLLGFKDEYRKLPSAYKTTAKIAQRILEHCLAYFICDSAPRIQVFDGSESCPLNEMYDQQIKDHLFKEEVVIKGNKFSLAHIKLYATHEKMHNLVLCAGKRDVKAFSLQRALGTGTSFDDDESKFTYALYVTGDYLDEHVDNYRVDFDIPEEANLLDSDETLTYSDMIGGLSQAAKTYLTVYLERARKRKEELVAKFVAERNPALRSVSHYCPEVYDELEPNSSDERIHEVLHHHKGKAEYQVQKRSDELLKTQNKSIAQVEESFKKLTSELTEFQKDTLAHYMCERKRIIDLFEKKLELNKERKHENEDIIHDIIFPRKTTTDEISFESHNLWLIDECLVFHSFASSDKPLDEISSSESKERPDIVTFAEADEDKIARAVSLLEFKKPQRPNFDEDPTRQMYRYLRKLREAKIVKLPNGRELQVADITRFYCYAICDINKEIRVFAENGNFSALKGELGFYNYNPQLNAHTEILAFDKLVNDAKRRHRAFFDKLGIGGC